MVTPDTSPPRHRVRISVAAARVGVTPRTVRRWVQNGLLPGYKLGPRLIVVDPADVDALLSPVGGDAR